MQTQIDKIQLNYDQCGSKECYDKYEQVFYEGKRREIILSWIKKCSASAATLIADIGCGYGITQDKLKPSSVVVGLDLQKKYLQRARENGILAVCANVGEVFPIRSESVDIVLAAEIIEHVVSPDLLLKECRRILKPKGKLIVTTPNLGSLMSLFYLVFRGLPCPAVFQPIHIRFFTFRSLSKELESLNFQVMESRTNEVLPGFLARYIPVIGGFLYAMFNFINIYLNRPFKRWGFQVIILASKS